MTAFSLAMRHRLNLEHDLVLILRAVYNMLSSLFSGGSQRRGTIYKKEFVRVRQYFGRLLFIYIFQSKNFLKPSKSIFRTVC